MRFHDKHRKIENYVSNVSIEIVLSIQIKLEKLLPFLYETFSFAVIVLRRRRKKDFILISKEEMEAIFFQLVGDMATSGNIII